MDGGKESRIAKALAKHWAKRKEEKGSKRQKNSKDRLAHNF
jgi:hypothetical protein